jgi:hypothetical protein
VISFHKFLYISANEELMGMDKKCEACGILRYLLSGSSAGHRNGNKKYHIQNRRPTE